MTRVIRFGLVPLLVLFYLPHRLFPSVTVNEIMNDPSVVLDNDGEWFELHNTGEDTIDLNGWVIRDGGRDFHRLTGETLLLLPGAYFVFGRNGDPQVNGGYTADYVYDGFTLSNGEDEVILVNAADELVDSVAFGRSGWLHESGRSLEFIEGSHDNASAENWVLATEPYGNGDKGTPGKRNSGSSAGIGGDVYYEGGDNGFPFFLQVFPNPFRETVTIALGRYISQRRENRVYSIDGTGVTLRIYSARGKLVRNLWEGNLNDSVVVTWDGRGNDGIHLPSGAYILRWVGKGWVRQQKLLYEGR